MKSYNDKTIHKVLRILIFGIFIMACTATELNNDTASDHFENGKFINQESIYKPKLSKLPSILYDFAFNKSAESTPKTKIPVLKLSTKALEELEDYSVIRFGHSTLLLKLEGKLILTDPMFSERASPFSFMGPKRFHEPPIDIEDLPYIDVVLISHDHYDHLDEKSIQKLIGKVGKFYAPLGVKEILIGFGVPENKIIELDWNEENTHGSLKFICTPAQHFSGRSLFNSNETLWASWVIQAPRAKLYFGGDGGYFEGFKAIALKFGPFDMAFLEVGAYNKKWKEVHMMPVQAVQAYFDLNAKVMFPIHNGTFDLSVHSWKDPFERVDKEAIKRNVAIVYPKMGEVISILNENKTSKWWIE